MNQNSSWPIWKCPLLLGGGVGTRGPGESQLESDRRLIRNRMGVLRKRLREVEKSRDTMREERMASATTRVALAGYTNAGKSSLMNALTGAHVDVENALFETLDATTDENLQFQRKYGSTPFLAQTKWITQNAADFRIPFTIHLGDVVDQQGKSLQWQIADEAIGVMESAASYFSFFAGSTEPQLTPIRMAQSLSVATLARYLTFSCHGFSRSWWYR